MKKKIFIALLTLPVVLSASGILFAGENDAGIRTAMVKIRTIRTRPSYSAPWDKHSPEAVHGSGCIIPRERILTNAHVVSDKTFIQVWRYGQTRKYKARVRFVSHEADLALLTVDDSDFFKGVTPLELGSLPEIQQAVSVMGFPRGGETLSITNGIVSRIEHQPYVHSSEHFLAIQIDAAVNPGNSGGPAMVEGKIVGVVMQVMARSQNISYIVPSPVVNHFLEDLEDGRHDGFPEDGLVCQAMENQDLCRHYGLEGGETGVLITHVIPGSPAEGIICPGDVILSVDGYPIANDGTVEFRKNERTSASFFVQKHQVGEAVEFTVLRSGEKLSKNVKQSPPPEDFYLVPRAQYDIQPAYFVYGGLVFMPLTEKYLEIWGRNWRHRAPPRLTAQLEKYPQTAGEQVIVLTKVLAHDVNAGYHDMEDLTITRVNGEPVVNMNELVHRLEAAGQSDFVEFTLANGSRIVLDPGRVAESRQDLLKTYSIPADRSKNLR